MTSKKSYQITVTYQPKFKCEEKVYFLLGNDIREGEIVDIFGGIRIAKYNDCKTFIEYRVICYGVSNAPYHILSENNVFKTPQEAENELPKQ